MRKWIWILLLLAVGPSVRVTADEQHHTAAQTVRAFHEALATGEKEKALDLLDPDVTIFESGGAELSRAEYADHHLAGDMKFSAATQRTIVDQMEGQAGDASWILTRSETRGTFREKDIDLLDVETVLLERGEHGWRIVHIHWSSRSRAKPH